MHEGLVFAGGETDFGFLQPSPSGKPVWHSLAQMISDTAASGITGPITSIVSDTNGVCFTDGKRLYRLTAATDSLTVINMEEDSDISSVTALVPFDNRVFIADNNKGLFVSGEETIERVPGGEKAAGNRFVRMTSLRQG